MRTLRSFALPIALFIGLAYFYSLDLAVVPYHPDETSQLVMSRDVARNWLDLAWRPGLPVTPEVRLRLLDAPLTRYVLGLSWLVQGYRFDDVVATDWQWGATWEANAAAVPSTGLLTAARVGPTLLTALTAALLYRLGTRLGGWPTGLLAALVFGLNPLVLLHGRRAMAEPALMFATTAAAVAAAEMGRALHAAWRRQRDGAVALEVEAAAPAEWTAQQMRIETASARERDWLPPGMPSLMPPDRPALPQPDPLSIVPIDPKQALAGTRRVVLPSPVAAPRWQAKQMRIGNTAEAEPIPGSTRPGHRLSLSSAWAVGWPGALWIGLFVGLSASAKQTGAVMLIAAWLAVAWVIWPRVTTGFGRLLAIVGFCALTLLSAAAVFFVLNPILFGDPVNAAREMIRLRQELLVQQLTVNDPAVVLADPLSRLPAMLRTIWFDAPTTWDAPVYLDQLRPLADRYFAQPLTAGWPQPWSGIVAACAFGLGLAAAVNRARRGAVSGGVVLAWLVALVAGLMLTIPLDWQRYFVPLAPVFSLLSAYGLVALIAARGDLRALGRR